MRRIRPRLTYANVIATIALFGVLAGGGAYAASKIGPNDIKKNAVRAKHIKKNQVRSKQIKNKQVKGADINPRAKAMWAAVSADGEIAAQSGGISVEQPVNTYQVKFPRSLQGKAIVATPIASGTLGGLLGDVDAKVTPCGDVFSPQTSDCTSGDNTPRDAVVSMVAGGSSADAPFFIAVLP